MLSALETDSKNTMKISLGGEERKISLKDHTKLPLKSAKAREKSGY